MKIQWMKLLVHALNKTIMEVISLNLGLIVVLSSFVLNMVVASIPSCIFRFASLTSYFLFGSVPILW